jgi:hypothetical protein
LDADQLKKWPPFATFKGVALRADRMRLANSG